MSKIICLYTCGLIYGLSILFIGLCVWFSARTKLFWLLSLCSKIWDRAWIPPTLFFFLRIASNIQGLWGSMHIWWLFVLFLCKRMPLGFWWWLLESVYFFGLYDHFNYVDSSRFEYWIFFYLYLLPFLFLIIMSCSVQCMGPLHNLVSLFLGIAFFLVAVAKRHCFFLCLKFCF